MTDVAEKALADTGGGTAGAILAPRAASGRVNDHVVISGLVAGSNLFVAELVGGVPELPPLYDGVPRGMPVIIATIEGREYVARSVEWEHMWTETRWIQTAGRHAFRIVQIEDTNIGARPRGVT